MKRTKHSTEQIIEKLRQADVALGKGQKVPEVCKTLGITEQTYYRWRQKYGGMAPDLAKQLRALEKENAQLKRLVANQALDMEILKEAAKGNWSSPSPAAWGPRRRRSGESAACLGSREGRSDTRRSGRSKTKSYSMRCGASPPSGRASAALRFTRPCGGVAGR
jgi:putative transposase